jgi:hypothetical protein
MISLGTEAVAKTMPEAAGRGPLLARRLDLIFRRRSSSQVESCPFAGRKGNSHNLMNMKRAWGVLLPLLLLAGTGAVQAQFDFVTNASDTNTITIIYYTGSGSAVIIPTNINNLLVTGIGNGENPVFSSSLTSVTIPLSVTRIADYAFADCGSLTSVAIPLSVTSIGAGPFSECISLTAITVDAQNSFYSSTNGVLFNASQTTLVQYPGGLEGGYTIPGSVTSLAEAAFYFCTSLSSVTIPVSVTNLGLYTFAGCASLSNVTIPGSVTSLGEEAFAECTSLTSVTIPASVTSIGDYAFSGCTSLASVTIPDGVTNISDFAFDYCSDLTNIMIPNSVTSLGEAAFYFCTSLSNVAISASVTNIGAAAFLNCTNLTGVYFTGDAPPDFGSDVFLGDSIATAYYLPGTTGWAAFDDNSGLSPAVIWNPLIQTSGASFGVQNNQFGFTITGTNNFTVVVEACTNLASPVWTPIQTLTLTNGSFYFSEPLQTNSSGRYYGLGLP